MPQYLRCCSYMHAQHCLGCCRTAALHLSVVCEQCKAATLCHSQPGALPQGVPACQQAGLVWPEVCWLSGPAGHVQSFQRAG
jgi:hypothetical protein